ncbi:MAG: hypothetical protein LKG40_07250 [Lachnospiraceae bacterium]|nr:hypothetical protein [Lachnospiraceae bacterium]MCI1328691.1 hypothetical protein [Lachnospiraceae bacterium]
MSSRWHARPEIYHPEKKRELAMARPAGNLPSGKETRARDGTAGWKFTIRKRKVSSRWHARPKIYHQEKKSEFTMARPAENVPSGEEKQVHDGKTGRKCAIRNRKTNSRWHACPKMCHQEQKISSRWHDVPEIPRQITGQRNECGPERLCTKTN